MSNQQGSLPTRETLQFNGRRALQVDQTNSHEFFPVHVNHMQAADFGQGLLTGGCSSEGAPADFGAVDAQVLHKIPPPAQVKLKCMHSASPSRLPISVGCGNEFRRLAVKSKAVTHSRSWELRMIAIVFLMLPRTCCRRCFPRDQMYCELLRWLISCK